MCKGCWRLKPVTMVNLFRFEFLRLLSCPLYVAADPKRTFLLACKQCRTMLASRGQMTFSIVPSCSTASESQPLEFLPKWGTPNGVVLMPQVLSASKQLSNEIARGPDPGLACLDYPRCPFGCLVENSWRLLVDLVVSESRAVYFPKMTPLPNFLLRSPLKLAKARAFDRPWALRKVLNCLATQFSPRGHQVAYHNLTWLS